MGASQQAAANGRCARVRGVRPQRTDAAPLPRHLPGDAGRGTARVARRTGSHARRMTRFPIRYTGANHAMVVLGLTPGNSRVEVFEDRVEVRMGWAFRATIERGSIQLGLRRPRQGDGLGCARLAWCLARQWILEWDRAHRTRATRQCEGVRGPGGTPGVAGRRRRPGGVAGVPRVVLRYGHGGATSRGACHGRCRGSQGLPGRRERVRLLHGRYSGPLAQRFADAVGVTRGQTALDVGCGPGALTGVLVDRLGADAVSACDPSEPFVADCIARYPGVIVRVAPRGSDPVR